MQSAQTQILTLLDYGRITATEAERLLVATAHPIQSTLTSRRILRACFCFLLALIAGAYLSPELGAIAPYAARLLNRAVDALPSLHTLLNRLMEAYL